MSDWYGSDDYFNRDGKPISEERWLVLRRNRNYKRIAWDSNADETVSVSTVWLGLNHNWDREGPPHIFETMIFGGEHNRDQWRWSTEEQARAGHAEICSANLHEKTQP